MSTKMPPVPPAERSDKGPGSDPETSRDTTPRESPPKAGRVPEQPDQQGQTGNTSQNTHNVGYQQAR